MCFWSLKIMAHGLCTRGLLLFLIYIDLFDYLTSSDVIDANEMYAMLSNDSIYNKLVPPANTVKVYAGYNLQNVNSFDAKLKIFSTTGFFTLKWQDDRLKWNSNNGDIQHIFVPEEKVWHPDLVVLNLIQELDNKLGAERPIRIFEDGTLVWKQIAILSTFCYTYVFFFPFDRQTCSLQLTSLDFPMNAVDLEYLETTADLKEYSLHAEWQVVKTSYIPYYLFTDNYQELNEIIQFSMELKRNPVHYIMIIIIPTIITAVLTFVTFFLPLKSGIRIGYILTVVLALVVILTLFVDSMPTSTTFPSILVISITVALIMAFLLIIITIFVMRLYDKPKTSKAPNWMHSFVRKSRNLKLKCTARKRNRVEQHQDIEHVEDGSPKEEIDHVDKKSPTKLYRNKELAEFFDYFLFVVYSVFYVLVILAILILAGVVYYYQNKLRNE
ncbi:acetylcholine receptor subunit beta-type unc-29-like [Mytilus trossulus]|uniref:acetylcholine receptor subunit beta-type unc-29-like n=1 Tax=Mytilus trossulus TaxID=6551 RepID=UPI0030044183